MQNGLRSRCNPTAAEAQSLRRWSVLQQFVEDVQALRAAKLYPVEQARDRAQECAVCGHIRLRNWPKQAAWVRWRCRYGDNAHANGSRVTAQCGIHWIQSGAYRERERLIHLKPLQRGLEQPKVMPMEITVSRGTEHSAARGLPAWNIPATTPCALGDGGHDHNLSAPSD